MPQTAFILILTPNERRGDELREVVRQRSSHSCSSVTTVDDAIASIRRRGPDVVFVEGVDQGPHVLPRLVEALRDRAPDAALLHVAPSPPTLPATGDLEIVALPPDATLDERFDWISRAARSAVARRDERILRGSYDESRIESFEGIIGVSARIRAIIDRIRKAARNKLTVLVLGETGTGKDLIARAIHRASDRASKPMRSVNCAGLNENLLESELFGHVRGAFTSAVADRRGYFEAAHGGTLLLDEVGDMPLTMQAKLLRVLETREITPVGSTEIRRIDVRVVAATHRDLSAMVSDGKFREDLYYRLHQWVIEVPPLRERREDIPLLVQHYIRQANQAHGLDVSGVTPEAMHALLHYFWPGNVRELANTLETLVVETEHGRIDASQLPERIRGTRTLVPAGVGNISGLTLAEIEKLAIQHTLNHTSGNREQAAKILGIGTRTLYRKIKEYGLDG
ncbi:MAG: Anaerobic nitric oxide reductase transcription regulator NorR [Phycisphaerae bacterium]|nr:Anaerobic nitric oxide reductase transcription regulator NorR [Phycisphaerae bacterium]